MSSSMLGWLGVVVSVTVGMGVLGFIYLGLVLSWEERSTRGLGYYGLGPIERDRFRRRLRWHARLLHPVLALTARISSPSLARASFQYEGVSGPRGSCSPESFRDGHAYVAGPRDVFVATQMKCGTTWMQHVVYEVLSRGNGDIVETGRTLYSISPWLEALRSVPVGEAPLIGEERPSRIIKTHFPVSLCPFDGSARYVYVVRHPASCFASCVDFITANLGPFTPEIEEIRAWFCSHESMWWGSWPQHVDGWWRRSVSHDNVLFVRFEDMKDDLPSVIHRVAAFLGVSPLSDAELAQVSRKCGFEYMRDHAGSFEMHPPHLLAIDAELFVKGSADRYRDIDPEMRDRIMTWSRQALADGEFPIDVQYPE